MNFPGIPVCQSTAVTSYRAIVNSYITINNYNCIEHNNFITYQDRRNA